MRTRDEGEASPEFELLDAGYFGEDRYFDVVIEYAKCDVDDILIQITASNRGPERGGTAFAADAVVSQYMGWGKDLRRPVVRRAPDTPGAMCAELEHWQYGKRWLLCAGQPAFLFTENETNALKAFNLRNRTPYVKDAFHEYMIHGNKAAVNPAMTGTKMGAHYVLQLEPGKSATLKMRLTDMESVERDGFERGRGGRKYTSPAEGNAHQECRAQTILERAMTRCLRNGEKRQTNSTIRGFRRGCRRTRDW